MVGIDSVLKSASGIAKAIIEFGLALIVVLLVVDIIFPDQPTGIVENVSELVKSFTSNGIVGLISLLFFLAIYKD
ncbi:MAG: hypothetical protein IIA59_02535 [Candidatus Marinimicrobia bacterium]|nr:hypothetical protein [Candidatus Neomarinimicrobiota bacterium]